MMVEDTRCIGNGRASLTSHLFSVSSIKSCGIHAHPLPGLSENKEQNSVNMMVPSTLGSNVACSVLHLILTATCAYLSSLFH